MRRCCSIVVRIVPSLAFSVAMAGTIVSSAALSIRNPFVTVIMLYCASSFRSMVIKF